MAAAPQNISAEPKVQAQLKNELEGFLNLYKSQTWSGQVAGGGNYPARINPHDTKDFVHNGSGADGSKAAIIYERFTNNAAWLVAWWYNNNTYKVYVETGPKANYANPNWSAIEENLRTRGGQSMETYDASTGTEIAATINTTGALNVSFKLW